VVPESPPSVDPASPLLWPSNERGLSLLSIESLLANANAGLENRFPHYGGKLW
jgi:hypothetical protein